MTYMALCEGTTCDKYDATNANWFKIDEAGLKPDGSGWWQQDISGSSHCYCARRIHPIDEYLDVNTQ